MSKNKNQRIYSTDHDWLRMLAAEQRDYIGRDFKLDLANNMLTIYALPRRFRQESKKKTDDKEPRNKRAESAARRG